VRKPRSRLSLVHAGILQAPLEAIGEQCGPAARVGENEHADRGSLPIAHWFESKWLRDGCFLAKDAPDRLESLARSAPEEREFLNHLIAEERSHYIMLADLKFYYIDPEHWFMEKGKTDLDGAGASS
jgi:hypothetical protein